MLGRKMDIKLANDKVKAPEYAHEGDAGLDLRVIEDIKIPAHQTVMAHTGIHVAIPDGCVGLLFPRSGYATKLGLNLANSVGVIDSSYRGEVCAALHNNSDVDIELEAGDRVAQLVVMPYVPCKLNIVEELDDTERGEGGFGSSGTK